VVFFGGRTQPLPACGTAQSAYREQAAGVLGAGIDVGSNSWVVVDGMGWGGIALHGFGWQGGIHMEPAASHDVFRHLEIYDNGTTFKLPDGTWGTISPGVAPHGAYHTFEYLDVHDNAEDSFQGNVDHLTIRYSWLHDDRTLPGRPGASFNYCEHNDGFQIYNGGVQSDLLIEHSVIGPGKSNGLILGNSGATGLNRLTVRDTLLLGANSNSVISNSAPPATGMNWVFDHVTSFSQSDNLGLSTQGATVTNSIFYGGLMLIHDGSVGASSGNCQWRTSGNVDQVRGKTADPRFVTDLSGYVAHTTDIAQLAPMEALRAADLTPRPGSPCAGLGASLSSVGRLLAVVLTP
jgi:hypothetical protein